MSAFILASLLLKIFIFRTASFFLHKNPRIKVIGDCSLNLTLFIKSSLSPFNSVCRLNLSKILCSSIFLSATKRPAEELFKVFRLLKNYGDVLTNRLRIKKRPAFICENHPIALAATKNSAYPSPPMSDIHCSIPYVCLLY